MTSFAAVDLGASSGRVMLGTVTPGGVRLREAHRFPNRPVRVGGTLHWDVLALWAETVEGVRRAAELAGGLAGIGVGSWAVDYALLDGAGRLLGNPVHYRDERTVGVAERVYETVDPAWLYARTGGQQLPFTTAFQLLAERDGAALYAAGSVALIPDLFGYWLTGELGTELTNASTTGLLDPRTRDWAADVAGALGVPLELFGPLREPGEPIGPLRPAVAAECAAGSPLVATVASHDTASAVAGVPARDEHFAYVSCGTWSVVGVELTEPLTSEAARVAGFGNELGVDGTVRFLRNVMGLWLLQECLRAWQRAGRPVELAALLAEAGGLPGAGVIDPDRAEFLAPGDMPARLRAECRRTGLAEPGTPAQLTRLILDSLAQAYRRAVRDAVRLTGRRVEVVHLVGGGARNALLCQLTADACELPVVAGPVEAAGYGNVLLQARAAGLREGALTELRADLAALPTVRYEPRGASRESESA